MAVALAACAGPSLPTMPPAPTNQPPTPSTLPTASPTASPAATPSKGTVAGAWSASGRMHEERADESTATLLADGTVLVANGYNGTAEIYDPAAGEFSE